MRLSLNQAADLLKQGYVVAVPTETVYGLAASLNYQKSIEKIYELKGRPSNNPLIIHLSDLSILDSYEITKPPFFEQLTEAFWPGPLTLVLPINEESIPSNARAGLPTAAFRIPSHPLILELLNLTGPLVMPSANLSGKPSATSPEHVENDFGLEFPILDGGACRHGLESTILYYEENSWKIVRQGAISQESFYHVLGYNPLIAGTSKILCPGQLYRHYAPQAKLILSHQLSHLKNEVIIGFSDKSYPESCRVISLGRISHPEEVGENLYSVLRELDRRGIEKAWVDIDFPREGLLLTIAERLERAAK